MTRKVAGRMALVAVMAVGTALGTAGGAQAAQLKYVALGDSYSAGSGVGPTANTWYSGCIQSARNYPKILAGFLGTTVKDVSCAGAETRHFRETQYRQTGPQLDHVRSDTELVTMTIGGNDSGAFFSTFFGCAFTLGRGPTCEERFGAATDATLQNVTYPAVVQALQDVRARAPKATVAILTYPLLLPPQGGCRSKMPIAERDVPYIYRLQLTLNDVIKRAARQTGAFLIDLDGPSKGHDACQAESVRWVEPVAGGSNIVHPGAVGMHAMAVEALKALRARPAAVSAPVRKATKPGVVLTRRALSRKRIRVGCDLRSATLRSCTVTISAGGKRLKTVKLTKSTKTRSVTVGGKARRLSLRARAVSTGGKVYTATSTVTRPR